MAATRQFQRDENVAMEPHTPEMDWADSSLSPPILHDDDEDDVDNDLSPTPVPEGPHPVPVEQPPVRLAAPGTPLESRARHEATAAALQASVEREAQLRAQLDGFKAREAASQAREASLTSALREAESQLGSAEEKVQRSQRRLESLERRNRELGKDLDDLERGNVRLHRMYKEVRADIRDCEAELADAERQAVQAGWWARAFECRARELEAFIEARMGPGSTGGEAWLRNAECEFDSYLYGLSEEEAINRAYHVYHQHHQHYHQHHQQQQQPPPNHAHDYDRPRRDQHRDDESGGGRRRRRRHGDRRAEPTPEERARTEEEVLKMCAVYEKWTARLDTLDAVTPDDIYWPGIEVVMSGADEEQAVKKLKALKLFWHPDKFMARYKAKISEEVKEKVLKAVTDIIVNINSKT